MPIPSRAAIRAAYAAAFAAGKSTFALALPSYLDAYVAERAEKQPGYTFFGNLEVGTASRPARNVELLIKALNGGSRLPILDLGSWQGQFWPGTKRHNLLAVLLETLDSGVLIAVDSDLVVARAKPGFAVDAFWNFSGPAPEAALLARFPVKID